MLIINLIVVTPPNTLGLQPIYINDSTDFVEVYDNNLRKLFQPVSFQLSAFDTKKDSVGNAEASAPFAYYFTTNLSYLLTGSLVEIYQTKKRLVTDIGQIPKVFQGYIGNIKQGKETTYEIISNLFLLKKYTGKRISKYCYKDFGEAECGVNLAPFTHNVQIATGYDRGLNGLVMSGCPDLVAGAFTNGTLVIENTVNYPDQRSLVAGNYHIFTDVRLSASQRKIWLSQVGTAARIEPQNCKLIRGCDRTSLSCYGIYNNIKNFGGFEFLPGNDRLFASN